MKNEKIDAKTILFYIKTFYQFLDLLNKGWSRNDENT